MMLGQNNWAGLSFSTERRGTEVSHAVNTAPDRAASDERAGKAVIIVDRSPLYRECLAIGLGQRLADCRVLAVSDIADIPDDAADRASIILYGAAEALPFEQDGAAAVGILRERMPAARLIVVSANDDLATVTRTLELGVHGFVSPAVALPELIEAIHLVEAGGVFIPASSIRRLLSQPQAAAALDLADGPAADLTPRQADVLRALRQGKPNKLIAYELGMRESTVKVHVRNILKKMGATNRAEVVYLTFHHREISGLRLPVRP